MEDAYEELLLEEELRYAVDTIKSLQPVLMVEAKVDFITAMRQALKGAYLTPHLSNRKMLSLSP